MALVMALAASSASASIRVKPNTANRKLVDVAIDREPLSRAILNISGFQTHRVEVLLATDPLVSYRARAVTPEAAMRALAAAGHARLDYEDNRFWLRELIEPKVILDVKDEDVRVILHSLQAQCHVKNLIIDPDVQGRATFLFRDLPCRTAFDTVFHTMGLREVRYSPSLVQVGARR